MTVDEMARLYEDGLTYQDIANESGMRSAEQVRRRLMGRVQPRPRGNSLGRRYTPGWRPWADRPPFVTVWGTF